MLIGRKSTIYIIYKYYIYIYIYIYIYVYIITYTIYIGGDIYSLKRNFIKIKFNQFPEINGKHM